MPCLKKQREASRKHIVARDRIQGDVKLTHLLHQASRSPPIHRSFFCLLRRPIQSLLTTTASDCSRPVKLHHRDSISDSTHRIPVQNATCSAPLYRSFAGAVLHLRHSSAPFISTATDRCPEEASRNFFLSAPASNREAALHHLNPASSSVAIPVQAVTISTSLHHRRSQTTTLLLSVQRRRSHLISPLPRSCTSHAVSLPHRIAGNQQLAGIFRRARRKSERTRGRRDPTPDPVQKPDPHPDPTRIRVPLSLPITE